MENELSAYEARKLLTLLSHLTVNELLGADAFDAVAKLNRIAVGEKVRVVLEAEPGHKVEAIKALRAMTGSGLKEAKDHYERYDEHSIGRPVLVAITDSEDAERMIAAARGCRVTVYTEIPR